MDFTNFYSHTIIIIFKLRLSEPSPSICFVLFINAPQVTQDWQETPKIHSIWQNQEALFDQHWFIGSRIFRPQGFLADFLKNKPKKG